MSLASTMPRRASATAEQDIIEKCQFVSCELTVAVLACAVAREVLSSMMRANALRQLAVHLACHETWRESATVRL